MNIEALTAIIIDIKHRATNLDASRGEHHGYLFDSSLFHCKSHLLMPCVIELEQTLNELKKYQTAHINHPQHVEYLCEKLVNQLSAIQRELDSPKLRAKESKPYHASYPSISQLYQDLAQHQEWERRLQDMLLDKNRQIETLPVHQRAPIQQAIITLEQRLSRCQKAKQRIEKTITRLEKKNRP
jgi:primosomal replication protein N''